MQLEHIHKLSFIISLVGILTLLLIINIQEPPLIKISEINEKLLNKQIKVQGQIINTKNHANGFTILTIKDNENNQIQAICNCPNIEQDTGVEIIGKVEEYKNTLQIRADKIIKITSS